MEGWSRWEMEGASQPLPALPLFLEQWSVYPKRWMDDESDSLASSQKGMKLASQWGEYIPGQGDRAQGVSGVGSSEPGLDGWLSGP